MKKILLIVLALTAVLCTVACGGASSDEGYAFTYKGQKLVIDAKAKTVLSAIGAPNSSYETGTCGRGDKDRMYVYSDFRVTTAEIDGEEYFEQIELLSDQVSTAEGVSIGDAKQAVLDAYGDPDKTDSGMLTYKAGAMNLYVYLDGNQNVKSILYKFAE